MDLSEGPDPDAVGARRLLPDHPGERRRLILRLALRITVVTALLIGLYALVPIPVGRSGALAVLEMAVGLLIFLVATGWQIRNIVRDDHPVLRAVEAVAFALPLLIVVFAFTYLTLSRADPASFSEHLDRIDALYYTTSTLATVGFGDITADSTGARALVSVQMLFDLALIAGLVRLVVLATQTGLSRRSSERSG
jgi:hypothetical protein